MPLFEACRKVGGNGEVCEDLQNAKEGVQQALRAIVADILEQSKTPPCKVLDE